MMDWRLTLRAKINPFRIAVSSESKDFLAGMGDITLRGKQQISNLEEQRLARLLRGVPQQYKMGYQLVGKETLSSSPLERATRTVELLARCVKSPRVAAVMSGHPR